MEGVPSSEESQLSASMAKADISAEEEKNNPSLDSSADAKSAPSDPTASTPPGNANGVPPSSSPKLDFATKHYLQRRWTLWYDNPGKKTSQHNWADNLKKLITFDTVEDFWCTYNNVRPASQLAPGSNYHLFLEGVRPMWEDPANRAGGKWVLSQSVKMRRDKLDKAWLYLFASPDVVTGCVVSIRRQQDRLALWLKGADGDSIKQTGVEMRMFMETPENMKTGYQSHADAQKRNSSFNNKPRYELGGTGK